MSNRGFIDRARTEEYLSAKIFGDERIAKVKTYCKEQNINTRKFLEGVIDLFFSDQRNQLILKSKDELIDIILKGKF